MSKKTLSPEAPEFIPYTVQNGAYNDPVLGPIMPETMTWSRTIDWANTTVKLFFDYRWDMPESELITLGQTLHAFIKRSQAIASDLTAFMVEETLNKRSLVAYFRKILGAKNLRQELPPYFENNQRAMWIWFYEDEEVCFHLSPEGFSPVSIWVKGTFSIHHGLHLKSMEVRKR